MGFSRGGWGGMRNPCGVQEFGNVKCNSKSRPLWSIKVGKCEIKVLVDTGATVNVMDEVVEVMERFALVSN